MIDRRRATCLGILAPLLLTTLVAGAGPASAAGPIERMPLWRLQVRITTASNGIDGAGSVPWLRLNGAGRGFFRLYPPSTGAFGPFDRETYDLGLLDSPSRITMLRLGLPGGETWCVKRIELIFNHKLAFDYVAPGKSCRTVGAGHVVGFSSAQLRSAPDWTGFSPPPPPRRLSNETLETIVTGVTGSTLRSLRGTAWDRTVPLTITRLTNRTFRVRFGIWVALDDAAGDSFRVTVSHKVRLFAGPEGRMRATGIGASCSPACTDDQEVALSDAVVAHLNTALNRLTVRPAGETDPLTFGMDAGANLSWRWEPVDKP